VEYLYVYLCSWNFHKTEKKQIRASSLSRCTIPSRLLFFELILLVIFLVIHNCTTVCCLLGTAIALNAFVQSGITLPLYVYYHLWPKHFYTRILHWSIKPTQVLYFYCNTIEIWPYSSLSMDLHKFLDFKQNLSKKTTNLGVIKNLVALSDRNSEKIPIPTEIPTISIGTLFRSENQMVCLSVNVSGPILIA
jgi:hypothetical protein